MTFDPFSPSPPDPPPPPAPPAVERGSTVGTGIAWAVIIVSIVALLGVRHLRVGGDVADAPAKPTGEVAAELTLRILSRNAIGARAWAPDPAAMQEQWDTMARQIAGTAASDEQRLRTAPVLAELRGADAALGRLRDLVDVPAPLDEDVRDLRAIYTHGPAALDEQARQRLRTRHGWYGQLALGWQQPPTNPDRRQAINAAQRTAAVLVIAVFGGLIVGLAGIVLFILAIVLLAQGTLRRTYHPPLAAGGVYVEAFALYLAWFIGLSLIARPMGGIGDVPWFWGLLATFAPLACLWPLFRGARFVELRQALGWHRGRGWLREALSGVIGYIAGLPVIALGLLITLVLARYLRAQPTHPIAEDITGSLGRVIAIVVLATIYAPLSEETMFRGALHHGMRRWVPFIITAPVVSFIFAIIHPQGLAAVPALMSIAIVLAALREWRGSLVAPVVAHAIHNGTLLVLLLLMVR